jgi:uncharacterized membrane protein
MTEHTCSMAKPDRSRLRAPAQILFMTLAGTVVYFLFNHKAIGVVIWLLTGLLLFGLLFAPSVVKGFDRFGSWLGRFVGAALTYILLVPMFYIIFSFGRIVITILGSDPMQRKWLPEAKSYWIDRPPLADATHFKRQYS